jgi:hypothetical protein
MKKLALAASALFVAGTACAGQPFLTANPYAQSVQAATAAAANKVFEPKWDTSPVKNWPAQNLDIPEVPAPRYFGGSDRLRVEAGFAFKHESYIADGATGQHHYETFMPGLKLGVVKPFRNGSELSGTLSVFNGRSSYSGAVGGAPAGTDVSKDGLDRTALEANVLYKVQTGLYQTAVLLGLGYQMEDSTGIQRSGEYSRRDQRFFATVGIERPFKFGDAWTVTPRVAYNQILLGRLHQDLQVGGGTVKEHGYGAEVAVDVTYRTGNRDLVLTPYARLWNVGTSSVAGNAYEPASRTREVGVSLTVRF